MRNSSKKLPRVSGTALDSPFDWPTKTCPLKNDELNDGGLKRYEFATKLSGQMFELTLRKVEGELKAYRFDVLQETC